MYINHILNFNPGVLPYELKQLLKYIISRNYVTLNEVNHKLETFPYGYGDIRDKPSQIAETTLSSTDSNSLKQNGMCCIIIL